MDKFVGTCVHIDEVEYRLGSFHQNQIELFIMIKGGLLYTTKLKPEEVLGDCISTYCVSARLCLCCQHQHQSLYSPLNSIGSQSNKSIDVFSPGEEDESDQIKKA